jgi:hypothetical protein
MMSGIQSIAQTESNKLAKLPELIEGKLLAKESSDENCTF